MGISDKSVPGFRREPRVLKLIFADPEMAGLEIRTKSVSLGDVRRVRQLPDGADWTSHMLDLFVDALLSWNLLDEQGRPVPATREEFEAQDYDFTLTILEAWSKAISGEVSGPLEQRSTGGEQLPEESIPMEVLSASP